MNNTQSDTPMADAEQSQSAINQKTEMTITHNPKLNLFIATVPRLEFRVVDYAADGKAAHKDETIAYQVRTQVKVNHVLAIGSKRRDVEQRANLKLMQGA